MDRLTVRDAAQVGRPSAVPGVSIPFVTAPAEVFTPAAVADAERRLAAVYAATRVEARMVVTPVASTTEISTPEGWPAAFDHDGDPDRDIMAVIGRTPDGAPVCCLTITGALIDRAQAEGYWRPADQPGALDGDVAAATAEFRDVALDRFVRGIEDLAPGVAIVEVEVTNTDIQRFIGLIAAAVPLILLVVVALRRRPTVSAGEDEAGVIGVELIEIDRSLASAAPTGAAATGAVVPWRGDDGGVLSSSRWPALPAWTVRPDRFWLLASFSAVATLGLLGVAELLLPAPTDVRLDPAIVGVGVTRAVTPVFPLILVAIAVGGLIVYARRGHWRRRLGVLALVLTVGWTMSTVIDHTRPEPAGRDNAYVASDGGTVAWRNPVGHEQLVYALSPGDSFTVATTVRNPGVLPMTILGLDGIATSELNPHLVSIAGVGWTVQPTDDGTVTLLSARPEDASASWPVTLAPGEELAIVLVGRGGPCADPAGSAVALGLTRFKMAYRVLGFERSTELGMPVIVAATQKDPCTVEIPGGTVTYGTPDQ
jgi:hypothetical protein